MLVNLRRILHRHLKTNVPIQTVLVVPFLLQVIGIVSLVAYGSYRNGQQAVQDLAYALTAEVSERVSDRLNTYLQVPHQFLRISRIELEQDLTTTDDVDALADLFWRQLQELDWLNSVHFTSSQGDYVGLLRDTHNRTNSPNAFIATQLEEPAPGTLRGHVLDAAGHPIREVYTQPQWDPRSGPWYQTAIEHHIPSWTPIYPWVGVSPASLTAVTPIYQNDQLQGVLGVDLELEQIDRFLRDLNFSSSGQVFLMERSGALVATSTQESTVLKNAQNQPGQRITALESQNPVIRNATQYLLDEWQSLHRIQTAQTFTFKGDRTTSNSPVLDTRYFAQVFPYRDNYGLDWLVVVVIPARDMTGGLYENIRQTVIWTGFALLGAIALGVYTTRWIMHPILGLRDAANRMAQGEFSLQVPTTPILELRQLAFSFREMANQVQLSLYEMQALNTDVNESRANLEKFLDGIPVGVVVHQADGSIAYLNQAAKRLLGVQGKAGVAGTGQAIAYTLYHAGTHLPYPTHQFPALRALRGEQVEEEGLEIYRDGRGIPVEVLATPIVAQDGHISHAIVAIQDITTRMQAARVLEDYNRELEEQVQKRTLALEQEILERQQIAATLHHRETTLRAILSAIPDLLVRMGQDGTYIERLSAGEVRLLEADSTLPGQKLHDFLPEAIAQSRLALIQEAIATGHMQIAEYQITIENEQRDEEIRVVKTGDEEVLTIVRDISDRKQAERALQHSEAQNRAILIAIPDLMFRVHRDGTYLGYVKTSALVDLLPQEFNPIGRHLSEYLPPDITQRHLYHIAQALDTGNLQVYEQENWIGGTMQYEEVRVIPCGVDEALFLIRDISDRKRVEKELRLANLRLEQLAQTDGLTQVANRRHFDDRLRQEWQTLAQEKAPLSLILFDTDYFKRYNDHYGHQAGDVCLIKIAAAARQIIRNPTDLVARYGGEEFAIILPRTNTAGAMQVAGRLQQAIQNLAIPHAQSQVSTFITISMGVSTLVPTPQNNPDNLLTQADQALYLAKQQGRDRVVAFPHRGDTSSLKS